MSNEYFKNVPQIGTLYLEEELFSFENIPIIFVCIDKNKSRYLCVCDDIIDEESWIIVKISNNELLDVINDECTVLSVYKNKSVIVANKPFEKEINYVLTEYNDIDEDELPLNDQYLEMKEYLTDYINKIKNSSVSLTLPLHLFDKNNFEQYIFDLTISNEQILQSFYKAYEELSMNITNSDTKISFQAEVEIEYETNDNMNSEELDDYKAILYAA
jgi:hypothetical protein